MQYLIWAIVAVLGYLGIGVICAGIFFVLHPLARDNSEGLLPVLSAMLVLQWPVVVMNGFQ